MIVTRQLDDQPWRWERQDRTQARTSFVALEGEEIVLGDQWGVQTPVTYSCDLESFLEGSFHAIIRELFDTAVLKQLTQQAKAVIERNRTPALQAKRLPWEPGGTSIPGTTPVRTRETGHRLPWEPRGTPRSTPLYHRSTDGDGIRLPWEPSANSAPTAAPKPVAKLTAKPAASVKKTARAVPKQTSPQTTPASGSVHITGFDKADLALLFALKSITGLKATELKERLRSLPFEVVGGLDAAKARAIQERLGSLGALAIAG